MAQSNDQVVDVKFDGKCDDREDVRSREEEDVRAFEQVQTLRENQGPEKERDQDFFRQKQGDGPGPVMTCYRLRRDPGEECKVYEGCH